MDRIACASSAMGGAPFPVPRPSRRVRTAPPPSSGRRGGAIIVVGPSRTTRGVWEEAGGGRRRVFVFALVRFDRRDLVLAVEPPAEVDQLAALAAKRERRRTGAGPRLFNGGFADGAAHHAILDL